jgi:hypothetical protein
VAESWNTTILGSEKEVQVVLGELRGKRWLCRGQAKQYGGLIPLIDRDERRGLSRGEKLLLERKSIDLFRLTARFFSDPGEQGAMVDDIVALMVLRHYGVPSRLLDWSFSPWVAAYFAVKDYDREDGEIWAFDEPLYERRGKVQWRQWPETTTDGSGDDHKFDAKLTAFLLDEPPDWFICGFYGPGFHRQNVQQGGYTMTARFGRDHASAIAELLEDSQTYNQYVIPARLKPRLRDALREEHGIWRGSLYPDSAGAADTARIVFARGRSGDDLKSFFLPASPPAHPGPTPR